MDEVGRQAVIDVLHRRRDGERGPERLVLAIEGGGLRGVVSGGMIAALQDRGFKVDKIDPVRFFPLIGPAQLHHCHWKCTIYYNETVQSDYPFPVQVKKPRVQVIYIDTDHLHLYPGDNPARQQTFQQETAGY